MSIEKQAQTKIGELAYDNSILRRKCQDLIATVEQQKIIIDRLVRDAKKRGADAD